MSRTPRPDNPPPTVPTIWASQHCRREMPSDASVLAGVVLFVAAVIAVVGGLIVWAVQ